MVNVAILQLCSMRQGEKMSPFQDQRDSWTRPLPPLPDQRDDLATGRTASTSWSQAYKMSQSLRPLETSGLYNESILKACKTHKKTTANHLPPKQFAKKTPQFHVKSFELWASPEGWTSLRLFKACFRCNSRAVCIMCACALFFGGKKSGLKMWISMFLTLCLFQNPPLMSMALTKLKSISPPKWSAKKMGPILWNTGLFIGIRDIRL